MKTRLFSVLAMLVLAAADSFGQPDLWIRDDVNDVGNEPNTLSATLFESDDIWVRRLADPNYSPHPFNPSNLSDPHYWTPQPNEDPCYRDPKTSSPNYIYVRIRNKGDQVSSGTETLHVYWAKASTGLDWSGDWNDHTEVPTCGGSEKLYGFEVTKPRKNGATATDQEKSDYVKAIQKINTMVDYQFNDPAIVDGSPNPDGFTDPVTYFDKQNEIHYNLFNAGIHAPSMRFLPWHRELLSRYEVLLREFNPTLTLLYWDWTTDPTTTGPINGPSGYMGASSGTVGAPFTAFGGILRSTGSGTPCAWIASIGFSLFGFPPDGLCASYESGALLGSADFPTFWANIESPSHNAAHVYNNGTMASMNAASDPLFFMLHANCDRLWAKWQRYSSANVNPWDPSHAYYPQQLAAAITSDMQPWDGTFSAPLTAPIFPWAPGGGYVIHKKPTSHSLVYPPIYDDVLLKVPAIPANSSCIIEIPFYPPSPVECAGFNDPTHLCLLARIEPVNVTEDSTLWLNVANSKRIAWKNTQLQDCNVGPWFGLAPGRIGGAGELIRNWRTNAAVLALRFDAPQTGFRTLFNFGGVRLRLEANLFQAWTNGGMQGTNVVAVGTNNEVLVLASGAELAGLALGPREVGHMDVALELNPNYQYAFGDVFHLDVLQFDDQGGTNAVGGQRYDLDFNLLSLVQKGSDWKFLDGGQVPATNWANTDYDDSGWKTGTALFGYGRGDIVTDLAGANGQPPTAYFRQTFTVPDPTFYQSLDLNMILDDGVVVYLNGQEIVRLNMATGVVTSATRALAPITQAGSRAYRTINVSNALTLLVSGTNTVAAEVHRATNGNPADLTFDLQLAANAPIIPYQPPTVVITSPVRGGSFRVGANVSIFADVLDPDGDLFQVRIYTNNVLLTTKTNPPYSAVFTAPALGDHRVSVEAQDVYGNLTRMESLFSVVSNLVPTVSMTMPTNYPMFSAGSAIQLAANAADLDGSITQVIFYVKEHMNFGSPQLQVGVDTIPPYSALATNLAPGHYIAYATTTDNQGGIGYALPAAFMIHQAAGTPELRIELQDLGIGARVALLEWDPERAVLETGATVSGPWTAVTAATSPYGVDPKLMSSQFFRLRLP